MKFLCDEMLKRLGRWLRAAGYDTVIEGDGVSDRDLIQRAVREGRLLITRDRKLMEFREAPGVVILLRSNAVQDCIQELTGRLGIDWTFQPFTRLPGVQYAAHRGCAGTVVRRAASLPGDDQPPFLLSSVRQGLLGRKPCPAHARQAGGLAGRRREIGRLFITYCNYGKIQSHLCGLSGAKDLNSLAVDPI